MEKGKAIVLSVAMFAVGQLANGNSNQKQRKNRWQMMATTTNISRFGIRKNIRDVAGTLRFFPGRDAFCNGILAIDASTFSIYGVHLDGKGLGSGKRVPNMTGGCTQTISLLSPSPLLHR